uniref:Odorant receptor n=1 Tax=Adelphocoris lineolatus TaxID=236346 RepID=A0A2I4PH22_ADELI|nr:olfactory receptor 21 [Adelphocoris lineolatus]
MAFGYLRIDWLTQDEVDVFDLFQKLMSNVGTMSDSKEKRRLTIIILSLLFIPMVIASLCASIIYRDDFDILAYSLHHTVLMSLAWVLNNVVIPVFRNQYNFLMEGTKKTYYYDSDLVNNYAKDIIHKRIGISRFIGKSIVIGTIGILIEIQIFFAAEVIWFQTYRTLFPVYTFGLDLDNIVVLVSVVLYQEVVMCWTANLPVVLLNIAYSTWSHLDLEMKILVFAITNVEKIVMEKSGKRSLDRTDEKHRSEIYESYCCHLAKHHHCIISYFEAYSQAVSLITTLMFTTGFIMFVLVGLSTMSDNLGVKLKLFWFLVFQVIITFGWCWVGQYIADKSAEISEAVMGTPWWLMPKSCHSTLLLIMVRCKKPLVITSSFGQQANMQTFMDMMKSVFQFVSVLYQVTKGENEE